MTEEAREVARRLFNKLTRDDKGAVLTVGIGKAATGKPVLIAYCNSGSEVSVPELFDGYLVLKSKATVRDKGRMLA